MNYLAHILLSGADRKMQLGNFIGDAVKGSAYKNYPKPISDGIMLHRAIDLYTDSHPAVKQAVRLLRPQFGRYSAILLDIYFDYLLACRFDEFSHIPLRRFTRRFYWTMIRNRRYLPERIRRFMWHFIFTDRLGRYATADGVRESLAIMVQVCRIDVPVGQAIDFMTGRQEELLTLFLPFFADLQRFCDDRIRSMTGRA